MATYSLLPIIQAFTAQAGVRVETRDISFAGRIIAQFPERLTEGQRQADALAELGALAKTPEANIIKLPNISASVPQLKAAVAELQGKGYDLPDYPDNPTTDEEKDVRARYDKVKGSAVNPVLREGNSDRRAPASVKQYARNHPHSMGAWSPDSKTNVAHMTADDFRSSETSAVMERAGSLRISLVAEDGTTTVLRESVPVLAGEVVDATAMHVAALHEFLAAQIARAKAEGVLFSVHLKATMMKVSDPIIFGHVVRAFLPEVFDRYGDVIAAAGLSPNNGLGSILAGLDGIESGAEIKAAIEQGLADGPELAMVDSEPGDHQPARPQRRDRGRVDAGDDPHLGPHVGSGRRGARHPGGHPGLLVRRHLPGGHRRLPRPRCVRPDDDGHRAERRADGAGGRGVRLPRQDLRDPERGHRPGHRRRPARSCWRPRWRRATSGGCARPRTPRSTNWVQLAVTRARATGSPAVFWLDSGRAHDANLIAKVEKYLAEQDTDGLDIQIKAPVEAIAFTPGADPPGRGHHLGHRQRAA